MNVISAYLNEARLWDSVSELSVLTLPDKPWTRRAFSPVFENGRRWLREQFEAAGLSVWVDPGGNLIGRREGRDPAARPLMTGSHCDTVNSGGRFDGIIGVLAGLEIARCLHEQNVQLEHPFELVDFLSEEPSDYGVSCVGSRAMVGELSGEMLQAMNSEGETLSEAIKRTGGQPDQLTQALRPHGSVAAFIELHIEQGPVLENIGLPIGIVTNIVGISRHRVIVHGRPDHAGTTPMEVRRDALVGAARVVLAANEKAKALGQNKAYLVATMGKLDVHPNASNAVPGSVEMMLEVRSDNRQILDEFSEPLLHQLAQDLESEGLILKFSSLSDVKPTDCDPLVVEAIGAAAHTLGYKCRLMPSGAGHDAMYIAKSAPMGMIFIPCLGGRSHCPEELITSSQLINGTRVLFQTILELDKRVGR